MVKVKVKGMLRYDRKGVVAGLFGSMLGMRLGRFWTAPQADM